MTTPEPKQPNDVTELPPNSVVEALRRVMRDLPAIGKDEHASPAQGGYAYRGIEAITRAAQMLLARYGVVIVPQVCDMHIEQVTVGGKPWTDTLLTVRYTFHGVNGPDDFIQAVTVGIGRDNADKGANKAMTQAFKYALLQVLCIADEKDDADGVSPEADRSFDLGGWESVEKRKQAHDNLSDLSKKLDEGRRAFMTEWRALRGYGWPMTREQYDDTAAQVLEQLDEQESAAKAREEPAVGAPAAAEEPAGPPAPESADGPSEQATAAPGAPDAAARAALALVERRNQTERAVKAMRMPDVRAELRGADLDETGTGPEVRERLIAHLTRPSAEEYINLAGEE